MDNNNNAIVPAVRTRTPRFRSIHRLSPFIRDSLVNIGILSLTRNEHVMDTPTARRYAQPDEFNDSDFYDSDTGFPPRNGEVYGKYWTMLRGRLVLGPGWIKLTATIASSLCLLGFMVMQHHVVDSYFGCLIPYAGYTLWLVSFIFLLATAMTDPGIMPRNIGYADHCLKYQRNLFRELGLPPRYCGKCYIRRPPRTYHCPICDICIRYQDLHVGMLGNCIGERNFRYYYILNLNVVLLSIHLMVLNSMLLRAAVTGQSGELYLWNVDAAVAVCVLIFGVIIFILPQLGFPAFIYRFYLISKDRTLREEFRTLMMGHAIDQGRLRGITKSFCYVLHEHLCPRPYTQSYLARRNQVSLQRGAGLDSDYPRWAPLGGIGQSEQNLLDGLSQRQRKSRKRSNPTDLFGNTSSAKRKAFYSLPMLQDGEVGKLPSTRARHQRRSRAKDALATKLVLYQELMETHKAVVDQQVHQHQNFTTSLSLGDMPRSNWNQTVENEILYQARATQIQRVIDLVQRRDRLGLMMLGRRINVGALMGLQELDPNNIQIIELNNNGVPILGGRRVNRGARQQQNRGGGVGISQLVAAGYMTRLDGSIVREMVPPALPALHANHQVNPALLVPPPIPRRPQIIPFVNPQANPRLFRNTPFRNNAILSDVGMGRGSTATANSTMISALNSTATSIASARASRAGSTRNFRPTNRRDGSLRPQQVNETRPEVDPSRVIVVGQSEQVPLPLVRAFIERRRSRSSSRQSREQRDREPSSSNRNSGNT